MTAPGNKSFLPTIDGRSVFRVLLVLAGLIGLTILIGSVLYWQLSDRFSDLDRTPWPLVLGTLIQTAVIMASVEFGWRRRKNLAWRDIGFHKIRLLPVLLVLAGGVLLAGSIEVIERQLSVKHGDIVAEMIAPQGFFWSHFLGVLLTVGLIAPLAEEVIFRGVIYSWLRQHMSVWPSIITSALAFSIVHMCYPLPLMILVAVMGTVFAWSFEVSRNLWIPTTLHVAQNSAVIIAIYLTLSDGSP